MSFKMGMIGWIQGRDCKGRFISSQAEKIREQDGLVRMNNEWFKYD